MLSRDQCPSERTGSSVGGMPWTKYHSEAHQRPYWHDAATKASVWARPADYFSPRQAAAAAPVAPVAKVVPRVAPRVVPKPVLPKSTAEAGSLRAAVESSYGHDSTSWWRRDADAAAAAAAEQGDAAEPDAALGPLTDWEAVEALKAELVAAFEEVAPELGLALPGDYELDAEDEGKSLQQLLGEVRSEGGREAGEAGRGKARAPCLRSSASRRCSATRCLTSSSWRRRTGPSTRRGRSQACGRGAAS